MYCVCSHNMSILSQGAILLLFFSCNDKAISLFLFPLIIFVDLIYFGQCMSEERWSSREQERISVNMNREPLCKYCFIRWLMYALPFPLTDVIYFPSVDGFEMVINSQEISSIIQHINTLNKITIFISIELMMWPFVVSHRICQWLKAAIIILIIICYFSIIQTKGHLIFISVAKPTLFQLCH